MGKVDLTVIILTYNEALHIARCIDSVSSIAKKIIVIDSYSTDNTVDIATLKGAEVFQNTWVNHAVQFQWALDRLDIDTQWIMRLDADEYVEPASISLFSGVADIPDGINGLFINRKYFFMGQWMKHGAMYPIKHMRIWRTGCGRMEDRWMDERVVLTNGSIKHLAINIIDDNKNDLTWWISKHNAYATKEMIDTLNLTYKFMQRDMGIYHSGSTQTLVKRFIKENVYSKFPLFVRPFFYFIYRYIFCFGVADGAKGLIFHFLHAFWYRILVDAKLMEARGWIGDQHDPINVRVILSEKTSLKL